jgi:branched-chain amino acid aminotransferase
MSITARPSTRSADIFARHLTTTPCTAAERTRLMQAPAFGTVFTDHMVQIDWTVDTGWTGHRVVARAPVLLDPAAAVLHYGQEIFEGLKAFRHADGSVWTFRPQANAERFRASARRMAMPELPVADFLGSLETLVAADAEWVPDADEASLYLRPFMFGSEAFLGVRSARAMTYLLIASPVGPYFASGVQPVSIWVAQDYHRAGPGGTGAAKCSGNYAASLLSQQQAYAQGCEQVCFLDAATGASLEELGGMNVFVVLADGSVATPRLTGTFLEGITRASIITLLRDGGREVAERDISLAEVRSGLESGGVVEVFACGTGAAVTPIGRLVGEGFDLTVADGGTGPVTSRVRRQLTDVQYGRAADPHSWMYRLD